MKNSDLQASAMTQPAQVQGEIIIMSSVNDMTKHFLKENVIIWHDPNIHSPENAAYINELKNICDVHVYADCKEASNCLKKEIQLSRCEVITSGTDGELFVKEISSLPFITSIYVYCDINNISYHKTWASPYPKVVCVEDGVLAILDKIRPSIIKWQRTNSSLRVHLPSFTPIFDDVDLSQMNNLQFYLQGLVNFTNRSQAKKDFLKLARSLYGKENKYIKKFEKNYNQYDMKAILKWYTKECFLYKLTNNCLRVATSDSIQYCRLALKDLENAIRDKYQQSSHNFSGLLYRGGYMSDNEWIRLQQNLNREIEMNGFLSTTKDKEIAIGFCQEDIEQKAMTTIIVPSFPEKGEQGFAEMGEYSDFSGEEEVLFNVRSRFTVLEATIEEIGGVKIRHLVLLYGAQAMRRYTTLHNPSIEVQMNITEATKCNECKQQINIEEGSAIAINIFENDKYLCKDCIKQHHQNKKLVLLCFSPLAYNLLSLHSEKGNTSTINLKIEGTVMRYQDNLNIPFYGDQCAVCKGTKLNCCYKCVDCKDAKIIYCNTCFHNQSVNNCLRIGHIMIGQDDPFCFWSDKMSKTEENHLNYHKEELEQTSHLLEQGEIFYKTHNYEKAIEYYEQYLKQHGHLKNKNIAASFNNLGGAHGGLGEYQKSIENYTKSLEINNAVFGNNHHETAASYSNLGLAYLNLGKYQKAIEYISKSLEINNAVFGNNHPETATYFNNLGGAYCNLGEYQKAIEYYSKSVEIKEVLFGNNHPDTAASYNNLAETYRNLGEYQRAVEYHFKSLEIITAVFGNNHPNTATSYNNLGVGYGDLGEYQKAIEYHSKSLEIRKVVFGNNHSETATAYNNLGAAYENLGEHQKAIEYFSKALKIKEAVFGNNHPETASSYNNLGIAYGDLKEYQKAIEYYSKSLEIRKVVLGNNHPNTATSYNNLGAVYENLGEYQKAIEYHSKSLEIKKAVFGNNHPETANSYNHLGLTYNYLGEYQKAKEYYSKLLEIKEIVFGNNHPSTASSYNDLGLIYSNLGESQKAIEYYTKSLEIKEIVFGNNHPSIATSYHNLGAVYEDLGEYQKAIEYHSKSLEIRKVVFGDDHSDTATAYHNLGAAYDHLGEYQKAIEYYSKSLEIRKVVLGNNHPKTASTYNNLGVVYENLGEYQKAIEYHSKALEIHTAVFGNNHPNTATSYHNLGVGYGELGKYQKAIEYHSKSLEIRKVVFGDDHPSTANSYKNLEDAKQASYIELTKVKTNTQQRMVGHIFTPQQMLQHLFGPTPTIRQMFKPKKSTKFDKTDKFDKNR